MLDSILKKHPSIAYAREVSAICSPLEKLNISYFAHVKINSEKQLSAISSNPLFTEHYFKNKFYNVDIHMVDEKKFGNFFVWDGIEFSGESGRMCREAGEFGIHNPFTIIVRSEKEINYYHFANNSRNKQINQAYLANLDLLNLFISYFNENVSQSKSLSIAYKLPFDINSNIKTSFEDDSLTYDRTQFIQSLSLDKKPNRLQIDNVLLSKRQSEILQLIVRGKTLKEISRILNLSQRTVGHYFEAVKMKLNVFSRSEVVAKVVDTGRVLKSIDF